MVAQPELLEQEPKQIKIEERRLTEINHLLANRLSDGSFPEDVLIDVKANLKTAVQEGGIPHAVSTTFHEYTQTSERTGVFKWMGRTAIENAESGYRFHISEAAHKRVAVEVDEAHHAQENLRPGIMKFFISPRMSHADADIETAKREHLYADDAVRASWLLTDESGNISQRVLQSLLVKDVPLQAWVDMAEDPNNPFGKSISIFNPESALSIMEAHREFELPLGLLQDGPVDLLRVVATYITNASAKESVLEQISKFESDQAALDGHADYIAEQWLSFEQEMAHSFAKGRATSEVKRFIDSMQNEWNEDDQRVIDNHRYGDVYIMTDELANIIEGGKQNTLWSRVGILSNTESITIQIDNDVLQQLQKNEERMYVAYLSNDRELHNHIAAENDRLIARQGIRTGNGCPGENDIFGGNNNELVYAKAKDKNAWAGGTPTKGTCVNCKQPKLVGVKSWCKDCISGHCG